MANLVGSAVISGLVEAIFDKLGSPAFQEIGRIIGVRGELKRLTHTLSDIKAVLLDAEKQQVTQHFVRNWLHNLKDAAYDIEDLLDLISTQALEKKVQGSSFAPKLHEIPSRYRLARKLKAMCKRLDHLAANRRNYSLQEYHQPLLSSVGSSRERETHSSIQETRVFGREQDKDWIVTHLVNFSSHEAQRISILPIVGVGGMGKTTLAKLVFNDPIIERFEVKLWVYIQNMFAMRTVIENIIESATGESCSHLNTETLKSKLSRILKGQTFLLVLDNVYIEDSKEWIDLMELLEKGSRRGVLIVTTREDRVALITGTTESYKLKPLSNDHCWSIFVNCAFKRGEEEAYPLLVQIGKDIIRKCCGVPLAAKTLGCQLRTVRDEFTWRSIEESDLWKIEQEPGGILPSLKLSFDQLPYYLRPCFSYCSAFPKGAFMFKADLIYQWMALGLLQSERMIGTFEDIGNKYFNELLSRSFLETVDNSTIVAHLDHQLKNTFSDIWPTSNVIEMPVQNNVTEMWQEMDYKTLDGKVLLKMHDLLHDLAAYVVGEETAFISCNVHDFSLRVRHMVWEDEGQLSERELPHQLQTANKARSLRLLPKIASPLLMNGRTSNPLSKPFLQGLISNFRCLRILTFYGFELGNLPNSIGDLKHLRYLSLSHDGKLRRLPDSVCKLVNLQSLILGDLQLELFPKDLHKLVSLRYFLFTSKLPRFSERDFQGWTSIQNIVIINCIHLRSLPEQIGTLTTLRILQIIRCPCLSSLPNSISNLNNLKLLAILYCQKLDLVGWDGLRGLRSLQELHFHRLPLLVHFPDRPQSMLSLRHLKIINCANLRALPECLQHCTCLLNLTLFKCSSLPSLPKGIQALKNLQQLSIVDCPKLNPRCEREGGKDWHLISHIPKIQVDHCFIQNKGLPTW